MKPNLLSRAMGRLRPMYLIWLVVMWILLMGELSLANLLAGVLVGVCVTVILPLPAMPVHGLHISWGKLLLYSFYFAYDFVRASVKVSWLALRRKKPPPTAIIEVPMRVETEFVLALAVLLYNLEPGGAVTDIDIARRMLTIHILDAGSSADIEREISAVARLERHLIEIFERSVA